jgi:hypothetical protein
MASVEDVIGYIDEIDRNDTLFEAIISQPVFLGNRLHAAFHPEHVAAPLRPALRRLASVRARAMMGQSLTQQCFFNSCNLH